MRGLFTISPPNGELARRLTASKSIWGGGGLVSRSHVRVAHERMEKQVQPPLTLLRDPSQLALLTTIGEFALTYVHVRLKDKKCLTSAT